MPSELEQVIDDVGKALRSADTVVEACQCVLDVISRHSDVNSTILLSVRDHLRTVAATGTWHVYSAARPGSGVVGRVYSSGRTSAITDVARDPEYVALNPSMTQEICTPIIEGAQRPIGVLNLEWINPINLEEWVPATERIARVLGRRIGELGGPPPESRSEKLLRHGYALATAASETELLDHSLYAARDVSGLESAVLVLNLPDGGIEVNIDKLHPTDLAARVSEIGQDILRGFILRARLYGASASIGDPATLNAEGFESLVSLGVRTLISIPIGGSLGHAAIGGVLLAVSDRASRPDPETVNLLSLLAAQAWSSRERIQTLAELRHMAVSDPLTGLRHHGSFSERLTRARPNHTAVFAIDIDSFKAINDTYGHQAGDRALVELARVLSAALRVADDLYRTGGDEFAAVMEVQHASEALRVANRLVRAARSIGQTISVGVAIQHEGETPNETLGRADAALYLTKRMGRDGVRMAA